jgi:hypothetical protein
MLSTGAEPKAIELIREFLSKDIPDCGDERLDDLLLSVGER